MRISNCCPAAAAVLFFSTHLVQASSDQLPSGGCRSTLRTDIVPGGPSQNFTFESEAGGGQRHYLLHVPASYAVGEPAPLILCFHGKGQPASEIEEHTQLSNPHFNKDAVVVYPQGSQWTGDPAAPPLRKVNDVEFTADLLDHIESRYCIDRSRIYATGFSNGGGLVGLLACNDALAQRIAAFAASSGAYYKDEALNEPLFGDCQADRVPTPFLEFHGSTDPVIHYDGDSTPDGPTYNPLEYVQRFCSDDAEGNAKKSYGEDVEEYYLSCKGVQDAVQHYWIKDFGHGWPTTTKLSNDDQRYGPTYFNATPIVMRFFRRWSLIERSDVQVQAEGKDEL
ncbi:putative ferulic acid esterase [Cryomyces antarcticus]